jgi:hypothetical protein|mmetsp:Transcript_30144/g.50972  ORF Transcript_30144/g.50972 Transcript_30144/m.50972 type:complete len:134 (-) Transcript_30144:379-780(-)
MEPTPNCETRSTACPVHQQLHLGEVARIGEEDTTCYAKGQMQTRGCGSTQQKRQQHLEEWEQHHNAASCLSVAQHVVKHAVAHEMPSEPDVPRASATSDVITHSGVPLTRAPMQLCQALGVASLSDTCYGANC